MTEQMRLTVLGSGGNLPTPMPTCGCDVCEQARSEGPPYSRNGNSLYLHEMGAVVDAPEYTQTSLNRERIDRFDYLFLTHWHPDHVAGIRAVQSRDFTTMFEDPDVGIVETARTAPPTIVTTRRVYERTCDVAGAVEHYVNIGWADLHLLDEDGPVESNGVTARAIPFSLEGDGNEDAAAFVFERGDRTLLVASDDARNLDEDALPDDIDLAVFECGYFYETPDGDPVLTETDRRFLATELSHEEVLARVERVAPDRAVLTEIEHLTARGHDDFRALAEREAYDGIQFAYDGLTVEV
jgi:phosphoribosyl 1,2-cyclic phosphate phosphodiesterase